MKGSLSCLRWFVLASLAVSGAVYGLAVAYDNYALLVAGSWGLIICLCTMCCSKPCADECCPPREEEWGEDGVVIDVCPPPPPPPPPPSTLVSLKEEVECTVCLESVRLATQTPCGHHFHEACLQAWTRLRPSCPNCRAPMRLPRD